MKFIIALAFVIIALASSVSAQWYVGGYCTKPCSVTNSLVCASNGLCVNMFKNNCQMIKWNCKAKDEFVPTQTINCLLGRQCQDIPVNIPE